jgi:hypothetical protein
VATNRRKTEQNGAQNGAQNAPEPEELRDLMEDLGADAAYLRLYRKSGGRLHFLQQCGLEIDPEWIRQNHGGGEFVIQAVNGHNKLGPRRSLVIEGPPKTPRAEIEVGRLESYRPAAPEVPGSIYDAVRRMDDILHELRRPPAVAQQANPLEMAGSIVTSVLTAAVPIIELMQSRPRAKAEGGAERLMDAFTRGMKIGVGLGRNGQAATWQDRLVEAVIPAIQGQPNPDPLAATESAKTALPPAQPGNPGNWRETIAPYIPRLNLLAAGGHDPQLYADLIYDQAPPPVLDMIVLQVGRGAAFLEEFVKAFPETAGYREWWNELLVRIGEVAKSAELGSDGNDVSGRTEVAAG